jgi:hypothetical protein
MSLLVETLLKTTMGKLDLPTQVLGLPTNIFIDSGVRVAVALFDRYMQYDDFIKTSNDKIAKIEAKQAQMTQEISANQKKILDGINQISVQIAEMNTKLMQQDLRLENLENKVEAIPEKFKEELNQHSLRILQDQLANAQDNLKDFFIVFKKDDTNYNATDAKNELIKIRDQFRSIRNHHLFSQRKDLQALTLISLSTIHKLLGEEELAFKYLVWIVKIPTSVKINQKVIKKLDENIQMKQEEIKYIKNNAEHDLKTKERDILTQNYNDYEGNQDRFKMQDQYVIDLQNEIKTIIARQQASNPEKFRAIQEAEVQANLSAEEQTKVILQNMLSNFR